MKKRILLLALLLCSIFCFAVACEIEPTPQEKFTVTYSCDTTGAITDQSFEYSTGVASLEVPVTLAEGYTQSQLTVTYKVGDGESTTAKVENGKITIANPNGNIVVTVSGATLNKYTVSFKLGNDVKHTATVSHGDKLTAADITAAQNAVTAEGYTFTSWSVADLANKVITQDLTVTATTTINSYKVEFLLGNDVKHTASVNHGETISADDLAAAQKAVTEVGYEFVKWEESVDDAITANTTIHAQTRKTAFVVTFVNGNITHKESVKENESLTAEQIAAAKTALTATGYHFVSFTVNNSVVDDLTTITVEDDITVTVATEINTYTVTIKLDNETKTTIENVEHGAKLTAEQIAAAQNAVAVTGYHVTWDKDLEKTEITDNTTFNATSAINVYTVKFLLGETTLESYQVEHGQSLTADQIAQAEKSAKEQIAADKRFVGWSVADLTATITDDVEISVVTRDQKTGLSVTFTSDPDGALSMDVNDYINAYDEDGEANFSLSYSTAYTQNENNTEVVVTYTMGESSGTLTRGEDGSYTIIVTDDVTITVSGLKLNQYSVSFDLAGKIIREDSIAHGEKVSQDILDAVKSYTADGLEVWGHGYNDEPITDNTTINVVYASAIASADDYLAIKPDGNYYLTADIDMGNNVAPVWGNVTWTDNEETCGDAKNGEYRGIFDGRNHTITFNRTSGCPVDLGDYGLMFYRLAGTVKNVNVNATLSGAYYANVFSAVTMQLVNGTIENVNVALNTVNASLGYDGTRLVALVGNFFGGTVKNCSVTFNTATYKLADEHVAPIGVIQTWADDGTEASKTVNGLAVHLPSNLKDIADLGTLATVPYLAKADSLVCDCTGYVVDYTAAKDNDFLWETATEISALGDSTLYTADDITAPRGFEKVFKSNGTYTDDNQFKRFLSDVDIEPYKQVAFALRTDNRRLCDYEWSANLDPNTWYVFIATKNADGTWTVDIHKETPSGEIAFSLANVYTSSLGDLYIYHNYSGDPTSIWSTELRVVSDPNYVPMTNLKVSALEQSTLQSDETAPDGFTSVYKSNNMYGAVNYASYLANINLEQYTTLYFALKTDVHDLTENNTWMLHEVNGQWGYYKCVKNADASWSIVLTRSNKTTLKISDSIVATKMSDLFTYLDDKWGENPETDNTIWATEVWGIADPNYVPYTKIADSALANPTDPSDFGGLPYPYDFTVMTRTTAEVEVVNNLSSYNGGTAFLADTDISAYSQVRFAIMVPSVGYRDYSWSNSVGEWRWGLFVANKQADGTWTLTVSDNGDVKFTITGITATKLSDLYRMQGTKKGEDGESLISVNSLIYSTEVYAK